MIQKCYNTKLLSTLAKKRSHIRALAREIGINPMAILRSVNELIKMNVVDFVQEGRNKLFFIKKTIEAKNAMYITECQRLNELLENYPHLRRVVEIIQKNKKINLAVIFGSYAKGIAKKDSDIDIFIETTNRKLRSEIETVDSRLSIKIGKYNKNNLLIKEIEKNHVIIKGFEGYNEKTGFFN